MKHLAKIILAGALTLCACSSGVEVFLRARLGVVDGVIVGEPVAKAVLIIYLAGSDAVGPLYRAIGVYGNLRDTPHDVDAELETFAVDIVSQRLEACAVLG